ARLVPGAQGGRLRDRLRATLRRQPLSHARAPHRRARRALRRLDERRRRRGRAPLRSLRRRRPLGMAVAVSEHQRANVSVARRARGSTRVFSRDHKVIARQFLWLGLAFLLVGGLMAMVMRWQLAYPGRPAPLVGVVSPSSYTTLFTLHGTIMIFFAITPILIGAF